MAICWNSRASTLLSRSGCMSGWTGCSRGFATGGKRSRRAPCGAVAEIASPWVLGVSPISRTATIRLMPPERFDPRYQLSSVDASAFFTVGPHSPVRALVIWLLDTCQYCCRRTARIEIPAHLPVQRSASRTRCALRSESRNVGPITSVSRKRPSSSSSRISSKRRMMERSMIVIPSPFGSSVW